MATAPMWWGFWGKAQPEEGASALWHPLGWHSLDVAAVAFTYLQQHPAFVANLARLSGLPAADVIRLVTITIALHDLGKFAPSFQNVNPARFAELHPGMTAGAYTVHHDRLGWLAFREQVALDVASAGFPAATSELWDDLSRAEVVMPWAEAVTGHHGTPPAAVEGGMRAHFGRTRPAVAAFAADVLKLFPGNGALPGNYGDTLAGMKRSSWLVAGLAVLADWLGSNQTFFPYKPEPVPVQDYWALALELAGRALAAANVLPLRPSPFAGMSVLFPTLQPSPLQTAMDALALPNGPRLLVAEDLTGSGKTEAAAAAAHHLMAAGLADGVFMALPTMATANAMHARTATFHRAMFEEGQDVSLALAHSGARTVLRDTSRNYARGDATATAWCASWLSDHRKKHLLAPVGVGTVDQALLGILASRHAPLRLLGLHRHVLIVDEVHAYDAYTNELLRNLLEFQAALGGHAILLSATLPQQTRARLVAAFEKGAGRGAPALVSSAYPLLTVTDGTGAAEVPVESKRGRTVDVAWLTHESEAIAHVQSMVQAGRCVAWVRNTVREAMEAYDLLKSSGVEVTLFHARFTRADRQRIESAVVGQLGPGSGPATRKGRVVVATQVIEQSLDVDFDSMVSDLCPVDLLIQRAGRLCRHARAPDGTRIALDTRGTPRLHVLAPAWTETPDPRWLSSVMPGTARVYSNHAQLWLTQQSLQGGRFSLPEQARHLIESVYGEAVRIPAGLEKAATTAEGKELADRDTALFNRLPFEAGYTQTTGVWREDTFSPTRLGDPSHQLRLVQRDGARLVPIHHHWGPLDWPSCEVSVRVSQVAQRVEGADDTLVAATEETMPGGGKWGLTVVLEATAEGWAGPARNAKGDNVMLTYSQERGLKVAREKRE